MKNGFTIIELLISLFISSFVAMGLFSVISSIADIRTGIVDSSNNIITKEKLSLIINRDTRMMIDTGFTVDSTEDKRKLKFNTFNTLRFNKSVPVEVVYYIDDDNYLIRRESNTELLYDMEMKLISNVTEMKMNFYDGIEYQEDNVNKAKLLKIDITIGEKIITIFTGMIK